MLETTSLFKVSLGRATHTGFFLVMDVNLNMVQRVVADAALTTSVAPPTHSIEGETLLRDAFDAFGVGDLLDQVRLTQLELERRLELQRLRWLALLTFGAFGANLVVTLLS